nr:unnamed protein product [Digitaria exilis]
MDVPESTLKFDRRASTSSPDGPMLPGHAAMMFTPGAITSGLSTDGFVKLGPRAENSATAGARARPIRVPANTNLADGRRVEPTSVAGRTCTSTESSCRFISVFARIMAAPPASFTASPLSARPVMPRLQTTIFPATAALSRDPLRQYSDSRVPPAAYTSSRSSLFPPFFKPPVFPGYMDSPYKTPPLPSRTYAGKRRSRVAAPTVSTHGASLATELRAGPLFPAAHTTETPRTVARKLPMAMLSSKSGMGKPPRERESTSTPSRTASSIPARMSEL